jgi:multidrug resistance efflux pump
MTPEQTRIAGDLRKGVTAVPAARPVHVNAGDVLQVLDALAAEKQRADDAEEALAQAKAPQPADPTDLE